MTKQTKTAMQLLEEAEQKAKDHDLRIAQLRERVAKEEANKAKTLTKVMIEVVKTPYGRTQMGKFLHHHADTKDQKIITELLGIEVINDTPPPAPPAPAQEANRPVTNTNQTPFN